MKLPTNNVMTILSIYGASFVHLLKVRERLVDVVLVVEAQPSHVDGVRVHRVRPQQVVGHLAKVGEKVA